MNKILVSVLIPVYNAEKWIAETLKSALNQTWQNIEIIVVDDGSTDNSLEMIKQFKDSRLKVFQQENKGGSAARNYAFNISTGKYIQFLDADDLLDKYKIERQLKTITNIGGLAMLTGPYYIFKTDLRKSIFKKEIAYKDYRNTFEWVLENFQQKTMFSPNCWLIPRELIIKAGPWNTQLTYNDDSEFFTRLALNATRIIFVKDAISYYRKGNIQSVSVRKDRKALQSRLLSLDLNVGHILQKNNNNEIKQIIVNEYAKFIFSIYPNYKKLRIAAEKKIKLLDEKPIRNFYNKKRLTGKMSKVFGWKSIKLLQYLLNKVFNTHRLYCIV